MKKILVVLCILTVLPMVAFAQDNISLSAGESMQALDANDIKWGGFLLDHSARTINLYFGFKSSAGEDLQDFDWRNRYMVRPSGRNDPSQWRGDKWLVWICKDHYFPASACVGLDDPIDECSGAGTMDAAATSALLEAGDCTAEGLVGTYSVAACRGLDAGNTDCYTRIAGRAIACPANDGIVFRTGLRDFMWGRMDDDLGVVGSFD